MMMMRMSGCLFLFSGGGKGGDGSGDVMAG